MKNTPTSMRKCIKCGSPLTRMRGRTHSYHVGCSHPDRFIRDKESIKWYVDKPDEEISKVEKQLKDKVFYMPVLQVHVGLTFSEVEMILSTERTPHVLRLVLRWMLAKGYNQWHLHSIIPASHASLHANLEIDGTGNILETDKKEFVTVTMPITISHAMRMLINLDGAIPSSHVRVLVPRGHLAEVNRIVRLWFPLTRIFRVQEASAEQDPDNIGVVNDSLREVEENLHACHLAIENGKIIGGEWLMHKAGYTIKFKNHFADVYKYKDYILPGFGHKHVCSANEENLRSIAQLDQPLSVMIEAAQELLDLAMHQREITRSFHLRMNVERYHPEDVDRKLPLHKFPYMEKSFSRTVKKTVPVKHTRIIRDLDPDTFMIVEREEEYWIDEERELEVIGTRKLELLQEWEQYCSQWRPYSQQKIAAEIAYKLRKLPIWFDMRVGKTQTAIMVAKRALAEGDISAIWVVCPVTNMYDPWMDELRKEGLHPFAFDKTELVERETILGEEYNGEEINTWVISFERLHNRLTYMQKYGNLSERIMVISDETSAIKNPEARRTVALQTLCEYAVRVMMLNGTPLEQGPADIWAQQYCIDGGRAFGATFQAFMYNWLAQDGGRLVLQSGKGLAFELMLAATAMRAIRSEADQFSGRDKWFRYIVIPPTAEMKASTKRIIDDYQLDKLGDTQDLKQCVLVKYGHMREVAAGYDKYEIGVKNSGVYERRRHKMDPKLTWLETFLRTQPGQPAVLYFEFTEAEDRCMEMLESMDIPYSSMRKNGGTGYNPTRRKEEVRRFQHGETRIILMKTRQARGITLHRIPAVEKGLGAYPVIIYMEPCWSLGSWKQSQDRCVGTDPRTGTSISTPVYVLAMMNSIESSIVTALRNKESVATALLRDAERDGFQNPFAEMDMAGASKGMHADEIFDAEEMNARLLLKLPPHLPLTEIKIKKANTRHLAKLNNCTQKQAAMFGLIEEAQYLQYRLEGHAKISEEEAQ